MPLPPGLAARLAKRGLVKETPPPVEAKNNDDEEIFAEDYDDEPKSTPDATEHMITDEAEIVHTHVEEQENEFDHNSNEPIIDEVINCPIKVNPYHECTEYCQKTYGLKTFEPDAKMLKLRERMLRRFPLPQNWKEVADPNTNRYYYWNRMTDQVAWLSPTHPKANVTLPADRLKGLLGESTVLSDQDDDEEEKMEEGSDYSDEDSVSDSNSEGEVIVSDRRDNRRSQERPGRGRENRGRGGRRDGGRRQKDELDPMDPASYSEAPRGNWSSGLDQRGAAKTGVDATASGPLFQQRPYPSPGAVLRANKQMTDGDT